MKWRIWIKNGYYTRFVEAEPVSYRIWNSKLRDFVTIEIPLDDFVLEFPDAAEKLAQAIYETGEASVIVEIPSQKLLGEHEILVPRDRVREHIELVRMLRAIGDGFWEDEEGERIELDSPRSPFFV